MNRDLERELREIEHKISALRSEIKDRDALLREYQKVESNIKHEINKIKFRNEYQYTTIEAIKELQENGTKVFRNSCPTVSGYLYLLKNNDGIMVYSEDDKKPRTLYLSHWNIDISWKEVYEVSEGVYE